jgi:hypothetical protein
MFTKRLLGMGLVSMFLCAAQSNAPDPHSIYNSSDIQWVKGPASLPPGAEIAVLEGDPAKEGQFTMRLRLPDGYKIPPHWHPRVEHVTVVAGTFLIGMGERFDEKALKPMNTGAFGHWPTGMRHFVSVKGLTVVQLHGVGPWGINYVNSSEDPRGAKKQ